MRGLPYEELRKVAVRRVKAKRDFWRLVGVFVIIWAILIAIWAMSGTGYFWPMWPIFGMGIALAFVGWGAYGPNNEIPEAKIDEEMRRLQQGG